MQEFGCVIDTRAKTPPGASMKEAAPTPQPADLYQNVNRGRAIEIPNLVVRFGRACLCLGVYIALSILTVFWTKHLVGGKVPTPLFLSWVQQAVGLILHTVVSAAVASFLGRSSSLGRILSAAIPMVRIRAGVMLRVLPLSFCFVGMIGFANLCLQRVQISVYQVARSLTLVFSLLLSVFWLKQRVVIGEVFSCLLVALGFTLMTAVGSDAASLGGYVMGALASLFQATYTVQMKATLNSFQQDAETLILSPKPRIDYELISNDLPETSSGGSATTPEAGTRTTPNTRGACSPSRCTMILVEPSLGSSALTKDDSEPDNLHIEEGIVAAQDKRVDDLRNGQAIRQEPTRGTCVQGTAGNAQSLGLKAQNISLEPNDSNRVRGDRQASSSANNGSPRVEPLCMFYNMLNALCIFPIVIILSGEPQVLWKLATEESAFSTTVLVEVIGIGAITFFLGSSIFWTVSLTSPLSFSVAGYVKTLLQVAVAMVLWEERLSLLETCGFLLTLSGSVWYSISRCQADNRTK